MALHGPFPGPSVWEVDHWIASLEPVRPAQPQGVPGPKSLAEAVGR